MISIASVLRIVLHFHCFVGLRLHRIDPYLAMIMIIIIIIQMIIQRASFILRFFFCLSLSLYIPLVSADDDDDDVGRYTAIKNINICNVGCPCELMQ